MIRGIAFCRRARLFRTACVRVVARLCVALLVLNAASPMLAASLSAPTFNAGLEAQAAGKLVICTPTGLRVIDNPDASGLPSTPQDVARDTFCPFSPPLSAAQVSSGQSALIALLPPESRPLRLAPPVYLTAPDEQATPLPLTARGPPAQA